MFRNFCFGLAVLALAWSATARADVVTDWNVTLNDAIIATPAKHNPGNPTRAMAMLNGAIYDIFQAVDRTHRPFKYFGTSPGADIDAAVARAAYHVLTDTYGEQAALIQSALDARLGSGPYSPAQQAGIALGDAVGQFYAGIHSSDDLNDAPWPSPADPLPGQWSSDPLHPGQKGWGSTYGAVSPWVMPEPDGPDHFDGVVGRPAFTDQEYVDAFNMVKGYGERVSGMRSAEQTEIGLFWAYDRPNLPGASGVGPPPVLFNENLIDIQEAVGNTPRDNARLFAMASVSMADAAIAAWDVKYEEDFWRPITAIRADAAHDDDNAATVEQSDWEYLGAPGADPGSSADDFTPPFPAYTSGHATMGGAVFKALELFYGTNDFGAADAAFDDLGDPETTEYDLHSNEYGTNGVAGMTRSFDSFTQVGSIGPDMENSPEGENGMSRIYLGIHWLFDQQDGIYLGNAIAEYAATHYFQAVPEPSAMLLGVLAAIGGVCAARRRIG
jgi:hypothetical protein